MNKASNKKIGNNFENEFTELLSKHGWWALNIGGSANGQPADVIAVKDTVAQLIDCKVCSKNRFVLSRVEPNQELSMSLWHDCNNGTCWFALKIDDGIYMLNFEKVRLLLANDVKSLNEEEIKKNRTIEKWLSEFM